MERRWDGTDAWMTFLVVMWGTAFVSIRELSDKLDPFEMTWLRYVPFLIFFGIWMALRRRERFALVTGPDWLRFTAAGFLGVLGYHIPLNWAMSDLTPGTPIGPPTAAILVATTPLWTLLFTAAVGQERFDARKALGALVAFIGVVIVVLRGTGDGDVDVVGKALIAMLAPILWAMYSIVAKPLIGRYGGLFVTGLTMCLGTLAFLPFGVSRGLAPVQRLDGLELFWLAYLSIAATLVGYTIWNQALKRRPASEVTVYIFAVPVVATIASVILLDQAITWWLLLGGVLVLGGLWQIHRARTAPQDGGAKT